MRAVWRSLNTSRRDRQIALGAFVALWASAFVPDMALFAVPGVLVAVLWLFWRRAWLFAIAIVVVSPCTLYACRAAFDYSRGTAQLERIVSPFPEAWNVDRDTRYVIHMRDCMIDEKDLVTLDPYNAALEVLSRTFGPMRGTYDGPYPTEAEAQRAVRAARPVSEQELAQDIIVVGGRRVRLRPELGQRMASIPAIRKGRAVLWQGSAVIVATAQKKPFLMLIDAASGKLFACYGWPPDGYGLMPLPWT